MRKYYLITIIFLFTIRLSAQQEGESISDVFVSESKDSVPYQLYLPNSYDTTQSYPLILWLHGKGERGMDNKKQMTLIKKWLLDSLNKEDYHSFLLAPQCSEDRYWNSYDKLANEITFDTITPEIQLSIMELINQIKKEYKINSNRIYIMGISMGGFGVFDMITRYPDFFAAAIPICGGADPGQVEKLHKTKIWAFHGAKDNIVDIRHSKVPMERIADSNHIFTIYPEKGHDAWNKAFKENELLDWLFTNKKEK